MGTHLTSLSQSIEAHIERINRSLEPLVSHTDQASRLAELGALSAMLAHEINHHTARAQAKAQLALRQSAWHTDPQCADDTIGSLLNTIRKISQLTESMMQYVDPHAGSLYQKSIIQQAHEAAHQFVTSPTPATAGTNPIDYVATWDMQGASVRINPVAMEQILINLYINAETAIRDRLELNPTATGVILIHAKQECSTWNTPRIRITVQDTGKGISPEDLPHVFKPWDRGGASSLGSINNGKPGHGLGLAVCQKLVQEAGGTIRCESTPGVGTIFTILLPAATTNESASAPQAA